MTSAPIIWRWSIAAAGFEQQRRPGILAKDGKELPYITLDGAMMSVPGKPGPALETGIPQTLFQTRIRVTATSDQFAGSGDGQRFLLIESIENEAKPLTVILNWPALLRK